MTTKFRIIAGFVVMILLMTLSGGMGYRSLQVASDSFERYDGMAYVNVDLSDLITQVYASALYLNRYMQTTDFKAMEGYRNQVDGSLVRSLELIELAKKRMSSKSNLERIEALRKTVVQIQTILSTVDEKVVKANAAYVNDFVPAVNNFSSKLSEISAALKGLENVEGLSALNAVTNDYGELKTNMALYARNGSEENFSRADTSLTSMGATISRLGIYVSSRGGQERNEQLQATFQKIKTAATVLHDSLSSAIKDLRTVNDLQDAILAESLSFNTLVDNEMRQATEETLASNKNAQFTLLALAVAGVLVGSVCALFIILALIKVLNKLSNYATAIAAGDLSAKSGITEKGEIGTMLKAIEVIPQTFRSVLERCDGIANSITHGKFRDRLEDERFQGAYKDLVNGINVLCDSYTLVLDELPVTILTISTDNKLNFINDAGSRLAPGDKDSLHVELLRRVQEVHASGKSQGEATINAAGKSFIMTVAGVEMKDRQGRKTGNMEILADISEIREQQKTMLAVAQKASEISDRVAAATEELAAQVEQVSRGAEMQRSQVESTASAMTEMNSTVMEVARNAGQAAEHSEATRQNADSGYVLVNKVVSAINMVDTVAGHLQMNMTDLGKKAENIGGVMNVISDIADQTNLLALNAAIEAARAGEYGRGFAVVADEVRKLAEKTMSATHEVGANISDIQTSAQTNIEEMGRALENVKQATSLANESGDALKGIVDLASSTSSVVASIATAAEEQSATSEEITRAVGEISHVIGETSDGMIQSSEAVLELSKMAQELRTTMEALAPK